MGLAAPESTVAVGGILNATRQGGATIAAAMASATLTRHDGGAGAAVPFLIAEGVCVLGLCGAVMRQANAPLTGGDRRGPS